MRGTEGEPELAHAFADTLMQLLESLTEPIIPASLHVRCTQTTSRDEAFEVTGSPMRTLACHSLHVAGTAFGRAACRQRKCAYIILLCSSAHNSVDSLRLPPF